MQTEVETLENRPESGNSQQGLEIHYWHRKGSHEYAMQLPKQRVTLIFFSQAGASFLGVIQNILPLRAVQARPVFFSMTPHVAGVASLR